MRFGIKRSGSRNLQSIDLDITIRYRSNPITEHTQIPDIELDDDEEILIEGVGRQRELWLTTYRLLVRRRAGWFTSRRETAEIDLEDINEMSIGFIRLTPLLLVGVAFVLIGVVTRALVPNNVADTLWSFGIVVTLIYVISGRRGLVVKSRERQIRFKTSGAKADEIRNFVFTLEDTRNRLAGIEGDAEDAGFRAGGGLPTPDEEPGERR